MVTNEQIARFELTEVDTTYQPWCELKADADGDLVRYEDHVARIEAETNARKDADAEVSDLRESLRRVNAKLQAEKARAARADEWAEKWQRAVSDLGTKALERAKRIAALEEALRVIAEECDPSEWGDVLRVANKARGRSGGSVIQTKALERAKRIAELERGTKTLKDMRERWSELVAERDAEKARANELRQGLCQLLAVNLDKPEALLDAVQNELEDGSERIAELETSLRVTASASADKDEKIEGLYERIAALEATITDAAFERAEAITCDLRQRERIAELENEVAAANDAYDDAEARADSNESLYFEKMETADERKRKIHALEEQWTGALERIAQLGAELEGQRHDKEVAERAFEAAEARADEHARSIVKAAERIAALERRLAVALECIADGIDDHWVEYPEHAKLIKEARGEGGPMAEPATEEQIRLAKRGSPGIVDKDQFIARIRVNAKLQAAEARAYRATEDVQSLEEQRDTLFERIAELEADVASRMNMVLGIGRRDGCECCVKKDNAARGEGGA